MSCSIAKSSSSTKRTLLEKSRIAVAVLATFWILFLVSASLDFSKGNSDYSKELLMVDWMIFLLGCLAASFVFAVAILLLNKCDCGPEESLIPIQQMESK